MDRNDVAAFDAWYAALVASPLREDLLERHLGLPPLRLVTGLVPWDGLDAVTTSLRLVPGELLLDLGSGRGGYGLAVAERTRARLLGIDFSSEAVRQAVANAEAGGQEADFRVGELEDTGLEADSVDAVMCLDSVQFAVRPINAYAEIRRVLRPGGRVVLTTWEARDRDDVELDERWRTLDVSHGLERAGFVDVEREVCDDWAVRERALLEEAAALGPGADEATAPLVAEARRALPTLDGLDRLMVTASAPS